MNTVKFAIFSDLHHDLIFDAPQRLEKFLNAAREEEVDFIAHLGDFCQPKPENQSIIDSFNSFEKPHYHVLGNHDMDSYTKQENIDSWGMPASYYGFTEKGFRFLACDGNFIRLADHDEDYNKGNYWNYPGKYAYLSQDELRWIEKEIYATDLPTILLCHQSFDDDIDGLRNRAELQSIINEANKSGKKVMLCINGHNHTDYLRVISNTIYFDLNSISYQWLDGCEINDYPAEYYIDRPYLKHMVLFRDPLFAIVTLTEDGTVEIQGYESRFDKSSPVELGHSGIVSGRFCTPRITSAKVHCLL